MKALAEADGVTLDQQIERLARAERQRRIGRALASDSGRDADEQVWLNLGSKTVAESTDDTANR